MPAVSAPAESRGGPLSSTEPPSWPNLAQHLIGQRAYPAQWMIRWYALFQEPAHIHVESQDSYAKFWLAPVRLAHSKGYNAPTLNKLHALIRANEPLFLEKWNEHITPLRLNLLL